MVSRLSLVALLAATSCFAQFPSETDRLMAAGRLWVTVQYFHPYLAYRDIDWDQALVIAIPKIRAAKNDLEYRSAISGMLDELNDPETYVLPQRDGYISGSISGPPAAVKTTVNLPPQLSLSRTATQTTFLIKPALQRTLLLFGGALSLSENAVLSLDGEAQVRSGRATLATTARHYQIESTEKIFLEFPAFTAVVRLSESLTPLPTNSPSSSAPVPIPSAPVIRPPSTRYTDPYPPAEVRLLAALKTWGAIHEFFAYKDLVDEDWDDVFASYLPKFIEAHDATDYNLTFADLLTHLTDTNTTLHSKILDSYFGEAPVGLRIRLLDKYPIVTDVLDPAATDAGVHPGDIVKGIGTEPITDRFRRFVQYVPASTAQRSGFDTIQRITSGPVGTNVDLTIENADGESHIVKLTRKSDWPSGQRSSEPIRILPGNIGYLDLDRIAPAAADAALVKLKDTKAIIFDLRGHAPAAAMFVAHLVSDSSTAAALVTTPIALHPDVPTIGIATQSASTFVVQTLPAVHQPVYKAKTVALIDERTIGESEYAGLLLEAANKTQFVGVPSAGADSSLADLPLPGGITLTYSTQDIRHGNGGKLERLGLQPNITAPTTAKGLRAGRDEPLDAALAMLSH